MMQVLDLKMNVQVKHDKLICFSMRVPVKGALFSAIRKCDAFVFGFLHLISSCSEPVMNNLVEFIKIKYSLISNTLNHLFSIGRSHFCGADLSLVPHGFLRKSFHNIF